MRSSYELFSFLLTAILLIVSYILYKTSKGKYFSELHEPRPVKRVIESEEVQKYTVAVFVSVLSALFITNNILTEIPYFNNLFEESEDWVLICIGTIMMSIYALFEIAFILTKKNKKSKDGE